jgi:putative membrane protein
MRFHRSYPAAAALVLVMATPRLCSAVDSTTEASVLARLHHDNQMEIAAGKLAQKRASSEKVREYGAMLVEDHTKADESLRKVAKSEGIVLAEEAAPRGPAEARHKSEESDAMERLQTLDGADFDREFVKAMTNDHDHSITTVEDGKDEVQVPAIRALLDEVRPLLQKHREAVSDLASTV